jgi:TM2 domain-containing membrane protein YozV
MKIHVKAALLSGLVLPGLGQIYKGEKIKGTILILLVNIFLFAAVYLMLKFAAPLILSAGMNGRIDAKQVLDQLHGRGPAVRFLLSSFFGLWLFGWIDAALGKSRRE